TVPTRPGPGHGEPRPRAPGLRGGPAEGRGPRVPPLAPVPLEILRLSAEAAPGPARGRPPERPLLGRGPRDHREPPLGPLARGGDLRRREVAHRLRAPAGPRPASDEPAPDPRRRPAAGTVPGRRRTGRPPLPGRRPAEPGVDLRRQRRGPPAPRRPGSPDAEDPLRDPATPAGPGRGRGESAAGAAGVPGTELVGAPPVLPGALRASRRALTASSVRGAGPGNLPV